MHDGQSTPWCNSIDARETGDIHLPWQSLFASPFPPHLAPLPPALSLSRLVSRLFSFVLIRSRFAIYHRSINLCRDSISTPSIRLSLRRQCFPLLLPLPTPSRPPSRAWILSQTQSGAPLRAKSEDMIARECLVFYKIGYPSWEILRERERLNFCTNWIALRRPLPFDSTVAFRSCFGTFRKIPCNLLKISCLFRRRLDANTGAVDRTSINVIRINVNPQRDGVARKYPFIRTSNVCIRRAQNAARANPHSKNETQIITTY